jgi:hypothetical protein
MRNVQAILVVGLLSIAACGGDDYAPKGKAPTSTTNSAGAGAANRVNEQRGAGGTPGAAGSGANQGSDTNTGSGGSRGGQQTPGGAAGGGAPNPTPPSPTPPSPTPTPSP